MCLLAIPQLVTAAGVCCVLPAPEQSARSWVEVPMFDTHVPWNQSMSAQIVGILRWVTTFTLGLQQMDVIEYVCFQHGSAPFQSKFTGADVARYRGRAHCFDQHSKHSDLIRTRQVGIFPPCLPSSLRRILSYDIAY